MKDYIIPEEFPEGPFGSPFRINEPVENKSTDRHSAFNYENKSLHEDLPRQIKIKKLQFISQLFYFFVFFRIKYAQPKLQNSYRYSETVLIFVSKEAF